MKKITMIYAIVGLSVSSTSFAVPFTYDFNNLSIGSASQDGWQVTNGNPTIQNTPQGGDPTGVVNSNFYYNNNGGTAATHYRDGSFLLPDYSNATSATFGGDLFSQDWGTYLGIGENGGYGVFVLFSDQRDSFYLRGSGFTDIVLPASNIFDTTWLGVRVEIDFLANNGAASASVFARDIATNSAWASVTGMQNINIGLTPGSNDGLDPANWNSTTVLTSTGINGIDNLTFDAQFAPAVPIPTAVWLFGSGLIGLIGVARRKA